MTGRRPRSGATRASGSGLALLVALGLAGCTGPEGPVPVACAPIPPSDPERLADTLELTITLSERPSRPTEVLVRVDPLSERGAVLFTEAPPETTAAVSVALTTDPVFQGCLSERADGFRIRAEEAPIGRVWVRVSSNRPVAVRLVPDAASEGAPASAPDPPGARQSPQRDDPLVVAPGASGRRPWPVNAAPGSRE